MCENQMFSRRPLLPLIHIILNIPGLKKLWIILGQQPIHHQFTHSWWGWRWRFPGPWLSCLHPAAKGSFHSTWKHCLVKILQKKYGGRDWVDMRVGSATQISSDAPQFQSNWVAYQLIHFISSFHFVMKLY